MVGIVLLPKEEVGDVFPPKFAFIDACAAEIEAPPRSLLGVEPADDFGTSITTALTL